MNIFLYTENFETQDFDVFSFDSNNGRLNQIPGGPKSQGLLKWISEREAPNEPNGDGISTWGASGIKAFLSFKIQIDQCAPKSGRTRLIFGTTEDVFFTGKLKDGIDFILMGINALLKERSLTIPSQRMQCLQTSLERNYQEINAKKIPFIKKAVGIGLLVAGSVMLIKGSQTDNKPDDVARIDSDLSKTQEEK